VSTREETPEVPPRPHQGDDLHVRKIVGVTCVFVGGIVFSLVVIALLFRHFDRAYPHRTSEAQPRVSVSDLPPRPRLQTAPARDLQEVRAAEDRHLSRYAWVDRQQGVAQIPIERAMALWVRTQGASAATNANPATHATPAGTTELQMRQDKTKEAGHAP